MGVIAFDEIKGPGRRSASQTSDWKRHYKRTFRAQTDSPSVSAIEVAQYPSVPILGDAYFISLAHRDLGAYVQQVDVEEETEDGKSWIITVTWGPYNANEFPKDPTQWPLRVSWSANQFKRGMIKDEDGTAVLNSASDPFEEAAERDDSRTICTTVRNEPRFDPQIAEDYRDHLNQDPFAGFAARCVKLSKIDSELKYDSDAGTEDGYYNEVTYFFEFNKDGWDLKPLDQGYATLNGGAKTAILDTTGQPLTKPQLLDGSGNRLADGADPVFLTFKRYTTADFAALGLNLGTAPGQSSDEGSGDLGDGDGDGGGGF